MASNYGLGVIDPLNPGLNDLLDVRIPDDVKKNRNNNRDYCLRWNNSTRNFVLSPTAVQQHDHPIDLGDLTDVSDESIAARKATSDATPFGFTWNRATSTFMPYDIPRNIDELLDSTVLADPGVSGIPYVLVYNESERKI